MDLSTAGYTWLSAANTMLAGYLGKEAVLFQFSRKPQFITTGQSAIWINESCIMTVTLSESRCKDTNFCDMTKISEYPFEVNGVENFSWSFYSF